MVDTIQAGWFEFEVSIVIDLVQARGVVSGAGGELGLDL